MPRSNASEGLVNHYHVLRMRVTGAGSLQMKFYSLDEVNNYIMVPFTLAATSAREPQRLSNFKTQRASLELKTTEINERFRISRIVLYVKPVEAEFPG